jgi:hypothetical protein
MSQFSICRICEQPIQKGEIREKSRFADRSGGWEHKMRMDCVRALQAAIAKAQEALANMPRTGKPD